MKPFHTVTVPHKDITKKKLTMDLFAAKLWDVYHNRGPEEYRDSETFFSKTYMTEGLRNIVDAVKNRIEGKGTDGVIQVFTPFGGGKTHAMIALFHEATKWEANRVVIVGTALDPRKTLWGVLEEQLTGSISTMTEMTAPGTDRLRELLEVHSPVLILMDEVTEYVTKAAGVTVGENTLASQTLAFMQELTELAGSMKGVCVVVTLPSSAPERFDTQAEKLFQQLQKVSGRVEKIFTPVEDNEITSVIRARLFSSIDQEGVKQAVDEFIEYADKEEILPRGIDRSVYRDEFYNSYPFLPEVVDMLYHRWGSFPNFQRTRGVLRLLSLVIASMAKSKETYITPGDFDLGNQNIRQELIKHIGPEYNGIIDADISGTDSNSKKVDKEMGSTYRGLGLGINSATTIFLHSFSGGKISGIPFEDVKRLSSEIGIPSSAVSEAVDKLERNLFFLQSTPEKLYFSNQPNLIKVRLTKMANIKHDEVKVVERKVLDESIDSGPLRVFIWEDNPSKIPDSPELKLVILESLDEVLMNKIIKTKGETPRVYRNTIFFLVPLDGQWPVFDENVRERLADHQIMEDTTLNLPEEQRQKVRDRVKNQDKVFSDAIRQLYRILYIPAKDGFERFDFGIPTRGERTGFGKKTYDKLLLEERIYDSIAPIVLRKLYLSEKDHVITEQVYETTLRTPGDARPVSKDVLKDSISEGVETGLFGLGELVEGKPVCHYFKKIPSVALKESEVLITEKLCKVEETPADTPIIYGEGQTTLVDTGPPEYHPAEDGIRKMHLKFTLPPEKLSDLRGVLRLLQERFKTVHIRAEVALSDGAISESDFENSVQEAFKQMRVKLDVKKDD